MRRLSDLLFMLLFAASLLAQDQSIVLEHADHMRTIRLGEHQVRELEGDVVVLHSGRRITFQLGRYNQQSGMLYCVKDVRVEEDGRSLEADELVYDERNEILKARGNVHASGDSMESWSQQGIWRQGLNRGEMSVEARVLDLSRQIELRAGEITADHEAGIYDATRAPVLELLEEPRTTLKANRISWSRTDSLATALYAVRLDREDFQAECDSMVWKDARGRVEFHKEPRLVREGREITGFKIDALLKGRSELDSLLVHGRARMTSPSDSVSVLLKDVLEGERLLMDFEEGRLATVFVQGRARSVIFLKDERGVPGMNVADADRMWFELQGQQLEGVRMGGGVTARWVPLREPPARTVETDGANGSN